MRGECPSLCTSVRERCEPRLRLLFKQQLVGQGVTFRPVLEPLVQHHTLGFSALEFTGQLLCGNRHLHWKYNQSKRINVIIYEYHPSLIKQL